MVAYNQCLQTVKGINTTQWAAFIDVDEFLYLSDHSCLMDYLTTLENDRGGLTINWRMISHSNHLLTLPMGQLLIEANQNTIADNAPGVAPLVDDYYHLHYKTVAKVERTNGCINPHECIYEQGWAGKDEYGHETKDGRNGKFQWPEQRIRLHHYRERTIEDFLYKSFRGVACWNDYVYTFDQVIEDLRRSFTLLNETRPEFLKPFIKPVRYILGLEKTLTT